MAVTEKLSTVCAEILNSLQCARAIEKYQQARPGALFQRSGDILTITLEDGKFLSLRDEWSKKGRGEAHRRRSYSYIEFIPQIKQHLVHVQYYEGHSFWLVDRKSENTTDMCGVPILSPSSDRFASYSGDLETGNSVEIWRITSNGFEREWVFEPTDWAPSELVWLSEDSIQISKEDFEGRAVGDAIVTWQGSAWTWDE